MGGGFTPPDMPVILGSKYAHKHTMYCRTCKRSTTHGNYEVSYSERRDPVILSVICNECDAVRDLQNKAANAARAMHDMQRARDNMQRGLLDAALRRAS